VGILAHNTPGVDTRSKLEFIIKGAIFYPHRNGDHTDIMKILQEV